MQRFIRLSVALGEIALLQAYLATPAWAQIAVGGGTSTPSAESTTSALPEAGTFSITVFLVIAGMVLASAGIVLARKTAKQKI